nr:MAG TPA: hypothetical protein [Caudoviricetes sp.]
MFWLLYHSTFFLFLSKLCSAFPFQSFSLQFLVFSCLFMLICYFSYPC